MSSTRSCQPVSKHLDTKNRSVITCFCLLFQFSSHYNSVFPTILQVVSLADIQSLSLSCPGTLPSFLPSFSSFSPWSAVQTHVLADIACRVLWFYWSHFHIAAGVWSPEQSQAAGCPAHSPTCPAESALQPPDPTNLSFLPRKAVRAPL